jgi:septum formation protein
MAAHFARRSSHVNRLQRNECRVRAPVPNVDLVLASTSPARRALMDALGVRYRVEAPGVDEDVPPGTSGQDAVALLAERKAAAVAGRNPGALVIGSDQLAVVEGRVLGKPADRDAARGQLSSLVGRTHEILTGVCVTGPAFFERAVDVARITFHAVDAQELERYLDLEEWRGCAGGYRVESAGQALFASLEGDRTGVQGLPMVLLVAMLRRAGVAFFAR